MAVPAIKGELSKITTAIFEAGGNIVGIGMKGILGSYGDTAEVVLKVQDVSQDKLVEALRQVVNEIMDVRDPRVDVLSRMFKPEKTTYARITYSDVAGLQRREEDAPGSGLSPQLLNHLSGLEGFVHVVRAFESASVPHPDGRVDPARDLAALDTEFLLSDLGVVERRIEKLQEGLKKGASKDKAAATAELALFEQMNETLSAERPLRVLDLSEEQLKGLRGYGLLTLKPKVCLLYTSRCV